MSTYYDAVVFDLFGTLIDNFSRQEYERVLQEMAGALGVSLHSSGFSAARCMTGLLVSSTSQIVGVVVALRVGAVAALVVPALLFFAL